jgi:general secretion pathway protein K
MAVTRASDEGYVTLAVLLVVGLLAAIVSSLLAVARPALGLARLGGDEVAAEALLQGGVTAAAFLLYGAGKEVKDVNKLVLRLHTGEVRLSVSDEGGLIDLNSADPKLLEGLFAAVGGVSMRPDAFASRVVDWRDEDSDVSINGAELSTYTDAGLDYGPPNLPFHSVDEARHILGLSPQDFERLKPYLTVFSGSPKIDPLFAPPPVLMAIPGSGKPAVQHILGARKAGRDRDYISTLVPEMTDFLSDKPSGVYRVQVRAKLKNGYADAAEAVIFASQAEGSADYKTVAWSKVAAAGAGEMGAPDLSN